MPRLADIQQVLPNITGSCIEMVAGRRIPNLYADPAILAGALAKAHRERTGTTWTDQDISTVANELWIAAGSPWETFTP